MLSRPATRSTPAVCAVCTHLQQSDSAACHLFAPCTTKSLPVVHIHHIHCLYTPVDYAHSLVASLAVCVAYLRHTLAAYTPTGCAYHSCLCHPLIAYTLSPLVHTHC